MVRRIQREAVVRYGPDGGSRGLTELAQLAGKPFVEAPAFVHGWIGVFVDPVRHLEFPHVVRQLPHLAVVNGHGEDDRSGDTTVA
jgi:hypothetical protein